MCVPASVEVGGETTSFSFSYAAAGTRTMRVETIGEPWREEELPDVGDLWLVDPETGREVRVDTRNRALRERFAAAAAEERSGVARVLAALGVPHCVLSTANFRFELYASGEYSKMLENEWDTAD